MKTMIAPTDVDGLKNAIRNNPEQFVIDFFVPRGQIEGASALRIRALLCGKFTGTLYAAQVSKREMRELVSSVMNVTENGFYWMRRQGLETESKQIA